MHSQPIVLSQTTAIALPPTNACRTTQFNFGCGHLQSSKPFENVRIISILCQYGICGHSINQINLTSKQHKNKIRKRRWRKSHWQSSLKSKLLIRMPIPMKMFRGAHSYKWKVCAPLLQNRSNCLSGAFSGIRIIFLTDGRVPFPPIFNTKHCFFQFQTGCFVLSFRIYQLWPSSQSSFRFFFDVFLQKTGSECLTVVINTDISLKLSPQKHSDLQMMVATSRGLPSCDQQRLNYVPPKLPVKNPISCLSWAKVQQLLQWQNCFLEVMNETF